MLTTIGWTGTLTIHVTCGDELVEHRAVRNQITHAGRSFLRDALRGIAQGGISYVALGAGADPTTGEELQLQDERFRKQITAQSPGLPGELHTVGYISEGEANDFTIEEVGWFAGDATGTADSGILIARVLYQRDKTPLETLQLSRTDAIVEVAP